MAIDEDDMRVLAFMAEHRVVVEPQVQVLLRRAPRTARRRLKSLAEAGLIERRKIFDRQPAAYLIRSRGLRLLERRQAAPEPNFQEYRHDVGIAWLWLAAHAGAFGRLEGIVSERAMRSADHRRQARAGAEATPRHRYGIGVAAAGPRGGLSLHYPDLLLQTATGHRVAIELELTFKGARRLDGIMLGYAADSRVDVVLYLCPTRALGLRVQAAARRVGLAERVQVQLLGPGSPAGAPAPVRMIERQRRGERTVGRRVGDPRFGARVAEL